MELPNKLEAHEVGCLGQPGRHDGQQSFCDRLAARQEGLVPPQIPAGQLDCQALGLLSSAPLLQTDCFKSCSAVRTYKARGNTSMIKLRSSIDAFLRHMLHRVHLGSSKKSEKGCPQGGGSASASGLCLRLYTCPQHCQHLQSTGHATYNTQLLRLLTDRTGQEEYWARA